MRLTHGTQRFVRALVLAGALVAGSLLPTGERGPDEAAAQAQPGRVLAPARGQVAWLDLSAPRPLVLTNFERPAYVADVAAAPTLPFAVASVVQGFEGNGAQGGNLLTVNLQSGVVSSLVRRQSATDSLDLPALWADGRGVLYQRSDLGTAFAIAGQPYLQYRTRIEQVALDGSSPSVVLDNARYPTPAPDGSALAFVRSGDAGVGIFTHEMESTSETAVVSPGQFLALAYPRYSPNGQQIAFAAISRFAPAGRKRSGPAVGWLGAKTASAHGFPWEIWLVNRDRTELRNIPDLLNDDPSVTWSPDGSELLVYGGWGSNVVDIATGDVQTLPFLAGYGGAAWLPDQTSAPVPTAARQDNSRTPAS